MGSDVREARVSSIVTGKNGQLKSCIVPRARRLAFRLAALQLNAIGPEEYETLRLRRLFQNRRPMMELEQELLHESVRRITVSNGTVTILLKNNQTLEGGNYT